MTDKYPVHYPANQLQAIIEDFLEGAPFTECLCDRITTSYDMASDPSIPKSYKRSMEFVKQIIQQSRHGSLKGFVYYINSQFEFTEMEIALVVRLFNLCYHGQYVIVLNDTIIYIPKAYRCRPEEEIRILTHKTIQEFQPGLSQWFNRQLSKLSLRRKKKAQILSLRLTPAASSTLSYNR